MQKIIRFHTYIILLLISSLGCFPATSQDFKDCDLIFQIEGDSDFSKAISSATAANDSIRVVHVGIIEVLPEGVFVIEANPQSGVRSIPLSDFTHNKSDSKFCIVKRLNIDFPAQKVLENAKSHIGEPYDWAYLPDNGKMYCSELVQVAFLDNRGMPIFPTEPMNFKDPSGNYPEFWVKLFEEQEMAIPQGVPGTNPQDIFRHPSLIPYP